MEIGIKAAKADLSRLIRAAISGERVVISDRGKPLVRLVPEVLKPQDKSRGFGSLKGVLNLPPGWDSLAAEEEFANRFEIVRERKRLIK
jgi:prevent-host-death family protein